MPDLSGLFDLTGRVAVVTGGAGLLGAEFCGALVGAGARVVIADLDGEAAEALAASLNEGRPGAGCALAVRSDVTSRASVWRMVEAALHEFGRLDVLVNSAALDPKFDPQHLDERAELSAFEEYPLEAWEQALQVNLTGIFLCCQAAARPMLEQGSGVIVNVCSIYGLVGTDQRIYRRPGQPLRFKPAYYPASKAGVLGLTRYLAAYYAGKNIRVNALSPGGIYNGHDPAFVQAYAERTMLGRMARKDEMNGALLFLCSEASSYMTGANLVVDGGWTAW